MQSFGRSILTILATAAVAGAQHAQDAAMPAADIVAVATKAGKFKTLLTAATAAGLVETLKSDGPFTVFAPTDAAFAKLPEGTVEALLADKAKLKSILLYHVVSGKVDSGTAAGLSWAPTVEGQSLRITADDSGVMVDGARVVQADIAAKNGVIHVIDSVVMPRADLVDTAIGAGKFKTLATALGAAGLVDTLRGDGPFTVFAPTDAAFAKLPEGTVDSLLKDLPKLRKILTYHVIPGRVLASDIPVAKKPGMSSVEPTTVAGVKLTIVRGKDGNVAVNGANVISADVLAGNGVIHVIDTVVLPPTDGE